MYLLIPERRGIQENAQIKFTFHNVSINSSTNDKNNLGIARFTFHNVSINSPP